MIRIAPGRQLRWSPAWPGEDASVLFDAASGDFWVLGTDTRELLQAVAAAPGISAQALLQGGRWAAQVLNPTLVSLSEAGILAVETGGES